MSPKTKIDRLSVRMPPYVREDLEALAEKKGVPPSTLVCGLIIDAIRADINAPSNILTDLINDVNAAIESGAKPEDIIPIVRAAIDVYAKPPRSD